jgi:hypothetical protein
MNAICRRAIVPLCFCSILMLPAILIAAEETSPTTWEVLFVNWFPMFLLIGVWIHFMRKMQGTKHPWNQEGTNQQLQKIAESLDRIARAIENK